MHLEGREPGTRYGTEGAEAKTHLEARRYRKTKNATHYQYVCGAKIALYNV